MDTAASMAFISAMLSAIIFVPVSVYGNIQLYKYRTYTFMQNRSLPIVFGLNMCFIAMMLFYPFVPIIFYSAPNLSYKVTGFIPTLITCWMLLLFLNLRNWLIYFNSHYTYHSVQLQWQQIINPNVKNNTNWFIDNLKKYGTVSSILKQFIIYHFIGFMVSMSGVVCVYVANERNIITTIAILIIILSVSVPIIFYTVILYKTPKFLSSHAYIYWESKLHAQLLVLTTILKLCVFIHAELGIVTFYFSSSVLSSAMCLIFFIMNYVSTYLLIKKNKIQTNNEDDDDDDVMDISLNDILGNKEAVHLLMVYLTTEFSIECLLSFIEMAQFQKYIVDIMEIEGKNIPITIETVISHANIPKSLILEKTVTIATVLHRSNADKRLYDAKMRAHKLYNKYIRLNSEFEINISSFLRAKLNNSLEDKQQLITSNITLSDLLELFEKPKYEMKKLLRHSYFRFKHQKQFEQVLLLFENKKSEDEKRSMDGIQIVYVTETNNLTSNQQQTECEHDGNQKKDDIHDNDINDGHIDNGLNQNGLEIVYDYNADHGDNDMDYNAFPPKIKLALSKSKSTSLGYVSMDSVETIHQK